MPPAFAPETATQADEKPRFHTPLDGIIVRLAQRIGGAKAKEVERFIKFSFIGLLGFFIDFGALYLLQSTILPPVNAAQESLRGNVALATTIGFVLAVTSNFIWNRLWTYPESRSSSIQLQLTQFVIVNSIGWAARTLWVSASVVFFGILSTAALQIAFPTYSPSLLDEQKLGTMVAQFIGVIVVMFWNFLANRYWTFNDVD